MLIERIWTGNAYRNFHYLVACPETGEALAIDPLEWRLCWDLARRKGWRITQILNTHEHRDHTGGNARLVEVSGAKVLAHAQAAARIGGVDRGLEAGDMIRVGRLELECLDTPGHTLAHICLLAHGERPALFSGDTLFNAGAGNCHNGGDPGRLYETFSGLLARLPDSTRIFPGHEYLVRNLEFTLDREPGNAAAQDLLARVRVVDPAEAPVTTLADERCINTFMRLDSATLIERLRAAYPDLDPHPDARTVFLRLRELRNRW